MSSSELIDDLRRKGEARIEKLWEETRREQTVFESEETEKLAAEEKLCSREAEHAVQTTRKRQKVTAQRQASAIITRAEQNLNERLFGLANDMLEDLRPGSRADMLRSLMKEVPESDWDEVTVHPDDVEAAKEVFPSEIISEDPGILGGVVVKSSTAGMTVVNTLRKRLERAWPNIGPEILRDIVENEISDRSSS